ncbi:MutT motif protein / mRNA de-capping protein [Squirrelpox virus]|uniref:MutT motif protein / mRNA de-capping protein n=1 Tax=Squirrelpox virus TaxID=240426 RepID=U3UBI8_9POXV|nr:MutT motif protein / mRNA de-capping protein [Squirrelpox virus]CCD83264.1 MutT motif protein / mRNA de-capping protein [Squirrelpox virus]
MTRGETVPECISRRNRKLARPLVCGDDTQRVSATAYVNQALETRRRISVCAILVTMDGKFLACQRRNSFLFSEIRRTRNTRRKLWLLSKHSRFLRASERRALERELDVPCAAEAPEHQDIIFPGGTPFSGEDAAACIARELKEETNVDGADVCLDTRFFIHARIDDLLIGRYFDTIYLLGAVWLTSEEIKKRFMENDEVCALTFLDALGEGPACDIVRYALSVSRLRCSGSLGSACAPLRALAAPPPHRSAKT